MKYKIKILILLLLVVIVIGAISYNIIINYKPIVQNIEIPKEEISEVKKEIPINESIKLCYYKSIKTDRDFYDKARLQISIDGKKVTGEFNNYPAEKDSKIGTFEGTVGPVDPNLMGRKAFVMWYSLGEGMQVKEELSFIFGEGNASIGFGGEQINRGDGVYIYKNRDNIYYNLPLGQIDCQMLEEKIFVEKYVTDNLATIVTKDPVLGGTWHVLAINAIPATKSGEVRYEDGHIEAKATFGYTYNSKAENLTIDRFEVIK